MIFVFEINFEFEANEVKQYMRLENGWSLRFVLDVFKLDLGQGI